MVDDCTPNRNVGAAREGARSLSADDTEWLVYELAPPFDRRSSPVLVFEAAHNMRVVRDYPKNWRQLSDEQLYALSWSR